MSKFIYILKAALHMRGIFGWWKLNDLRFCWETAATVYDGIDEGDHGDPVEDIREELSRWGD